MERERPTDEEILALYEESKSAPDTAGFIAGVRSALGWVLGREAQPPEIEELMT
jgi:hypothetical protein